jgi:hypothetical protein
MAIDIDACVRGLLIETRACAGGRSTRHGPTSATLNYAPGPAGIGLWLDVNLATPIPQFTFAWYIAPGVTSPGARLARCMGTVLDSMGGKKATAAAFSLGGAQRVLEHGLRRIADGSALAPVMMASVRFPGETRG